MESAQIHGIIQQIAETSSKNEKTAIIKAFGESAEFCAVLNAALNPLISYGIAQRPTRSHTSPSGNGFTKLSWDIISDLQERKLTGNAAKDTIQAHIDALCPFSAELFLDIITKDLKAGFSESTVNKAIPGLIPDFPYQRCSLPKDAALDKWDWANGVFSQEKADAMFANCDHDRTGGVRFTSRQGTPYPLEEFSELINEIRQTFPLDTQTHGEMMVTRDGEILPREISNGIMNHVIQGGKFGAGEKPLFLVWEQIPLDEVKPKNTYNVPYKTRFSNLQLQLLRGPKLGNLELIRTRIVNSMAEANKHFAEMLAEGKEGTVLKERNAPWRDGTSKFQVKRKIDADCDLRVIGFEEGKGKNASLFGSLICTTSCESLQVSVSGISDKLRKEIHDNRDDWLGSVITVKFNTIMYPSEEGKKHSLFLPRFVERRLDKSDEDSLQRVIEQYEAAIANVK